MIVSLDIQTGDAPGNLVLCRRDHDRHVISLPAQAAQQRQARSVRQRQVKKRRIELRDRQCLLRLAQVSGMIRQDYASRSPFP